jgi:bis(5'-nucleosyl)-tetraphosphatase (symmetrical)
MDEFDLSTLKVEKYAVVKEVDPSDFDRLIVIGDVHGCYDELLSLICALSPQERALTVFVGDLIDRGPDSRSVVRLVRSLVMDDHYSNVLCTLGNHEEKTIRYRYHTLNKQRDPNYRMPMKPFHPVRQAEHDELSNRYLAWMAQLPAVVRVGNRLITHAGIMPMPLSVQPTKAMIRTRYVHKDTGKMLGMGPGFSQPPDSVPWDEAYQGADRVIYGHIVYQEPRIHNNCYGIDTGCVFGGRLTAYVEDLKTGVVDFVSVPALKAYGDLRSEDDK